MKTIGLIGGMSWESTIEYYRIINEESTKRLGGLHSAKIVMWSLNFSDIVSLQKEGKWDEAAGCLSNIGKDLVDAGADCLLICTNTMHKVAEQVQRAAGVPLIHIADAAGEAIRSKRMNKVGLLGTRFTMVDGFYSEILETRYGLEVITPEADDLKLVHDVIFNELCQGIYREESKTEFCRIIDDLAARGAEGVVLGCTEIPLLVTHADSTIPLFDTTHLHACAAVDWAFAKNGGAVLAGV